MMIIHDCRRMQREIADLESGQQSGSVLSGYVMEIHMLTEHPTIYYLREQIGIY